MNNKKMKLTIITSLLLGFFIFIVFALVENLKIGIIFGLLCMIGSFLFLHFNFSKSGSILRELQEQYGPNILYGDTAGMMVDAQEIIGALIVTMDQLVFSTKSKGNNYVLSLAKEEIAEFSNQGGFLQISGEQLTYIFKVFDCDAIIQALSVR